MNLSVLPGHKTNPVSPDYHYHHLQLSLGLDRWGGGGKGKWNCRKSVQRQHCSFAQLTGKWRGCGWEGDKNVQWKKVKLGKALGNPGVIEINTGTTVHRSSHSVSNEIAVFLLIHSIFEGMKRQHRSHSQGHIIVEEETGGKLNAGDRTIETMKLNDNWLANLFIAKLIEIKESAWKTG